MEHQWMLPTIIFLVAFPFSMAQLSSSETRILFQIQRFLEYPPALEQWNKWTNFCTLPPNPSLTLVCSSNHISELTIVGNKSFAVSEQTLSDKFSLESFFTVLTKLSSLQKLSLVSLGLWGQLPAKISRFRSLEVLNISSNFIYGDIPPSISSYQSLKSLVLSNNLLNGSVPDLSVLSVLEELDLSSNFLGPEFPSLGNDLVSVLIGNNSLKSKIPQDFSKMNRLQVLDLSSNNLIGSIPSFLFSMPSIQYISLAKNQLSGVLAADISCNIKLGYVDISNNLLTGKLPSCLASNVGNRTLITLWNCLSNTTSGYQRPTSFCQKDDALVVHPSARTQKEQRVMKLGTVVGIIGGIVAILGVLGFIFLAIMKRAQRKRGCECKYDDVVIQKTYGPGSSIARNIPQTGQMASPGLPPYHVFTIEEIKDATNNFDTNNLVGEGSQGQIYKGKLRNGSSILVKCIKLKQKYSPQALQHHMEVVSKLRHRHLVSVLGHGIAPYQDHPNTTNTVYIFLENIAKGSLRDHLTDWRKREVLKWPQRMAITMGIARGIQYLHTGGVQGNNLKIENILLDECLNPKISSYKIALPSKVGAENSLDSKDTSNHEDPEKEDIYQLGVILTEVITGRPIQSKSESDDLKYQIERSLSESPSKLRDLVDPSMCGTFAYESLKTVAQITVNCLCKDPIGRPTVEDVLWHLQYSVQVQEGWTNSGNLSGNISGNR
ncbi:LOW QUALITY PROTEIN: probable LRR receptor-like serine/threonine-protein kinase At1g14390 [Primulina eburnea]|uniref:LOW QUALITY PROTEIN: probable LRR receptor-like serine/threonine-protein kinase At1g14390 n=1 Tax=Primulina eburnea TaxID=1245227 RepID=UPI003C6C9ACF